MLCSCARSQLLAAWLLGSRSRPGQNLVCITAGLTLERPTLQGEMLSLQPQPSLASLQPVVPLAGDSQKRGLFSDQVPASGSHCRQPQRCVAAISHLSALTFITSRLLQNGLVRMLQDPEEQPKAAWRPLWQHYGCLHVCRDPDGRVDRYM